MFCAKEFADGTNAGRCFAFVADVIGVINTAAINVVKRPARLIFNFRKRRLKQTSTTGKQRQLCRIAVFRCLPSSPLYCLHRCEGSEDRPIGHRCRQYDHWPTSCPLFKKSSISQSQMII